jgi:hypothetical protein
MEHKVTCAYKKPKISKDNCFVVMNGTKPNIFCFRRVLCYNPKNSVVGRSLCRSFITCCKSNIRMDDKHINSESDTEIQAKKKNLWCVWRKCNK